MKIHLVDATHELFRNFHTLPSAKNRAGEEVAAVRATLHSFRGLALDGATHFGVAVDRTMGSFRNALWEGYRRAEPLPPDLESQVSLLEAGLAAWGLKVWTVADVEADDAISSAAAKAVRDDRVESVVLCSPRTRLAQCVRGARVVQFDRARGTTRDESGVVTRFGVPPSSIPDYLALVGDASLKIPGIPGWGAKSAATVLGAYRHLAAIPADAAAWSVPVGRSASLASALDSQREQAALYRRLLTLRVDVPVFETVDELQWHGPTPELPAFRRRVGQHDRSG